MNNTKNRELHQKLLEIMDVFHNLCEKNKIKYFILGGTMLGAFRHKGFIPWDDDMDVGLPREDYEKLLNLPKSEWPDNLIIKTPNNSKDLIFPYSKIINKSTTLIEDRLDGIIEGIYIDVFPLDGAGNFWPNSKLSYYIFYLKQGLLFNNQDHGLKKTLLRRIFQKYARLKNTRKIYENVDKFMKRYEYNNSRFIGNYAGAWRLNEFMEKNIMEPPKLYSFEHLQLYGPNRAEEYLTRLYGDFMKLPPIEKRKSHHSFKYINLELPYEEYLKQNMNK